MSYFANFPRIPFYFGGKNLDRVPSRELISNFDLVTNITLRFKISEMFKNTNPLYNYYTVADGERPDIVAHKLYSDANLHWIILLYNEIMNPNFEWPKDSITLQNTIADNYRGSDIFLNVNGNPFYSDECNCSKETFNSETYLIESGNKVLLTSISTRVYEGEVISWDSNLGILNVLFKTNNFNQEQININPSEYTSLKLETKLLNETPITVELIDSTINIVRDKKYSVHHFERNGEILNPFSLYENILETEVDEDSSSYFQNEILRYQVNQLNDYCFSETLLGKYSCTIWENTPTSALGDTAINPDYIITNMSYEFQQNENKRSLIVPAPSSIESIIKEYKKLFS